MGDEAEEQKKQKENSEPMAKPAQRRVGRLISPAVTAFGSSS
jgi:hypothetical protein